MRPVFDLSKVYKIDHPGVIDADGHVLEPPDLCEIAEGIAHRRRLWISPPRLK